MTYTETHTVKNLLDALASSPQPQYDAVLFDGTLINADTLARHVRGLNASIPLICVGGEVHSDGVEGQVCVISSPPDMRQLYEAVCKVTGTKGVPN